MVIEAMYDQHSMRSCLSRGVGTRGMAALATWQPDRRQVTTIAARSLKDQLILQFAAHRPANSDIAMAPCYSNAVVSSPTSRQRKTLQTPIHFRRSKRLAIQRFEKALQLAKAETSARTLPRRSQRLIERALKNLCKQTPVLSANEKPSRAAVVHKEQRHYQANVSISPAKKAAERSNTAVRRTTGTSVKRAIVFPASPGSARNSRSMSKNAQVNVPPALLQMERECSDLAWLLTRWNDVPYENRVSWDNVLARRGKFLQLACKSGDVSLVKAVLKISTAPAYRSSEKWKFVDAVHYGVEYQLYDLLPWLNRFEQSFPNSTSPCESKLMNMALAHGDLRTAEWLYANRMHVHSEPILQATRERLQRQSPELRRWVKARYPGAISA